ncbi:MAG: DUF4214 domain-containing protein [Acidobacteriota bacterium]|nr:DUF4214 domain-containing protein [Acidobacteriota bacterium]
MKLIIIALAVAVLTTANSALGQTPPSPPTLRIVTEDPNLPSQLFYGTTKIKPLRLRPGTNVRITWDDNDAWLLQHYVDFLNRMPDPGGFAGWMAILNQCPPSEVNNPTSSLTCTRIDVSSAFFRSTEFQLKGYYLLRFYQVSLGRVPSYAEFGPDMRLVTGQTDQEFMERRNAFPGLFVARTEFRNRYDALSNAAYVSKLAETAVITIPNSAQLVGDLDAGRKTRAQVLREIVESTEVERKFYNSAFVTMQYFGYLRRDPDMEGYNGWMEILNRTGDYRYMVWGFVYSPEYREKF